MIATRGAELAVDYPTATVGGGRNPEADQAQKRIRKQRRLEGERTTCLREKLERLVGTHVDLAVDGSTARPPGICGNSAASMRRYTFEKVADAKANEPSACGRTLNFS
ncbi:hypothetical protein [Micromonospora inyonensis]|uniref:hypothetical protein n=1 Tax=Micromonospora inyonensis TaxID=47866 RepID=UPI00159F1791|nr:hypothetical protein [Micromonospora inyonensis]